MLGARLEPPRMTPPQQAKSKALTTRATPPQQQRALYRLGRIACRLIHVSQKTLTIFISAPNEWIKNALEVIFR